MGKKENGLAQTLKSECSACEWIEAAWIAPNSLAFVLQLVIGKHESTHKKFKLIEPKYSLSSEVTRTVGSIVRRIKQKHVGLDANVVSYKFNPHPWIEVYRKT